MGNGSQDQLELIPPERGNRVALTNQRKAACGCARAFWLPMGPLHLSKRKVQRANSNGDGDTADRRHLRTDWLYRGCAADLPEILAEIVQ